MVELYREFRDTIDTWLDFHGIYSRNSDKVCQWLSGRIVRDNLYAIRLAKVFLVLGDSWMQLSQGPGVAMYPIAAGYHQPLAKQGLMRWLTKKHIKLERMNGSVY